MADIELQITEATYQGRTFKGTLNLSETDPETDRWTDFGDRLPDSTNTGLRTEGTPSLPDYNPPGTNEVTIPEDAEVVGMTIWGRIRFAAAGRIADCVLKGPQSMPGGQTGVIDVTGKRGGLALIEDSLCDPVTPNHRMDFIVGRQFRAYRNRVRGVVDGFGTFTQESWAWPSQIVSGGVQCDVEMGGNWVEQHIYFFPDDNHSDGPHTDGWQHQGGLLVKGIGNRFSGYSVKLPGSGTNPDKPWLLTPPNEWANGAGVIVQDNVGCGLDSSVIATRNWFEGYVAHGNLKNGGPYEFSENKHSRDVAIGPSSGMSGSKLSGYWVRLQSRASTKVIDLNTNRWVDGPYAGDLLTEPRDSGINYDS